MTHRCQGCGRFVDPDAEDVIDQQIPGGPRITDHEDCHRRLDEEQFAEGMASLEPPEGGWPRGSDMDRI